MSALWLAAALLAADTAHWSVEPPQVEVGEPARVTLVLEHDAAGPARGTRSADSWEPAFDESWVVLEEQGRTTVPVERDDAGRPLRARTTASWTVASLEPGARELPRMRLRLGERTFEVEPARVDVLGVLASDEDGPRPERGFHLPPPEAGSGPGTGVLLALAVGLLALAALGLVLARRRAARRTPVGPTGAERLAGLEAALAAREAELRAAHFELTRLVRAETDRGLGRSRAGLTDEEWLAAVRADGRLDGERTEALERLLARCARVKYAGDDATSWAVQEALAEARRALAPEPVAADRREPAEVPA